MNHLEANGIETRDLLPLINQPIYRKMFGDLEPHYPVARWLNESGFYIGCHQYMTPDMIDHVTEVMYSFFGRRPTAPAARRPVAASQFAELPV